MAKWVHKCQKWGFVTIWDAYKALDHTRAKFAGSAQVPCRAYECQICGRWHLTSKPLRRRGWLKET